MPPQLHHRHAPAIQAPPPTHDRVAEEARFSGVVRVDVAGEIRMAKAYGFANRACGTANTVDTQFGIASGTKGLTALAVLSLIEHGQLELTTTARSVLGPDLPLVDDNVTVEDLLSHRSGIGDLMDIARSSPLANGSRTATAATSSSR